MGMANREDMFGKDRENKGVFGWRIVGLQDNINVENLSWRDGDDIRCFEY